MKAVLLNGQFKEMIAEVCGRAPGGMTVAQVRARMRVLDALAKCDGKTLVLEDADHTALQDAINVTAWTVASREVLALIDAVADAEAPA